MLYYTTISGERRLASCSNREIDTRSKFPVLSSLGASPFRRSVRLDLDLTLRERISLYAIVAT